MLILLAGKNINKDDKASKLQLAINTCKNNKVSGLSIEMNQAQEPRGP